MSVRQRPLDHHRLPESDTLARATAFAAHVARRRTVRDFAPDPVPRAVIERCLAAAGTAPSGANQQPWHFVAIGPDPELRHRIRTAARRGRCQVYSCEAFLDWLMTDGGSAEEKPTPVPRPSADKPVPRSDETDEYLKAFTVPLPSSVRKLK